MKKCIESLLPGGEDVEILIVDDGSSVFRQLQPTFPEELRAENDRVHENILSLVKMLYLIPAEYPVLRKRMAVFHHLMLLPCIISM